MRDAAGAPALPLRAAWRAAGAEAELRDVVIGRLRRADALIGAFCHAGAWWQTLALERVAASATAGDAVLAMDSVASLRLRDCALAAGRAGRSSGCCRAHGGRDRRLPPLRRRRRCWRAVIHVDPARPLALRLTGGAALTIPAGELPPGFAGEAGEVARRDGRRGDRRGRGPRPERVVAADARLEQRLP